MEICKVLLIEDELAHTRLIRTALQRFHAIKFEIVNTQRLFNGIEIYNKGQFDIVLLDLNLPDSNGIQTFQIAKDHIINIPIIILSSLYDQSLAIEAAKAGVENFITKSPENYEKIGDTLRFFLERWKSRQFQIKLQKFEVIETLAQGLAHDFKNILMGIMGNMTIMKLALKEKHILFTEPYFQDVEQSIFQATDICNNLMQMTKEDMYQFETDFILKDALMNITNFTIRGTRCLAEYHISEDLSNIKLKIFQFRQVLNNLLLNSIQAMDSGGIIKIQAENVSNPVVDSKQLIGQYVLVKISDEGTGMSPDVAEKCFDSNFTTKASGSGLGLTMVKKIITENGGTITLDTEIGKGTSFSLILPAIQSIVGKITKKEKIVKGNGQKIILMDDNEIIRIVGKSLLTEIGYNPRCVSNTKELLNEYKIAMESGVKYSVAILDLTIPGEKGGLDAIKQLLEIDPSVRAILTSAYITKDIQQNFKSYGFKELLLKPYNIYQFSQIIHDSLIS